MIDDIVFDNISFLVFEKGNVPTGQITSFDLSGGSVQSSTSIETGEVFL